MSHVARISGLAAVVIGLLAVAAQAQSDGAEFKPQFVKLCDLACEQINDPERQVPKPVPFYNDSYAVRALCVAYDLTGKDVYLEACRRWADRMLEYQKGMTPKGAYYMNYRRKPGEKEGGGWYVADSSSIAMGVLATAVRCSGPEKERYLASVKQFAGLVAKNYVGEAGGIMNGGWEKYCGEWWCSSGVFASLAFLLADETGDEQYREIGLGAVNWLNHLDLTKVKFNFWGDAAPSVMMYVLEGYSAGMPSVPPGSKLHNEALSRIEWAMKWMAENQKSRSSTAKWDYSTQWGSKLGGMPFHMYVLSRHMPEGEKLRAAADAELRYVAEQLVTPQQPKLSQLACFAMMSYAERLRPGAIYRTSRVPATAPSLQGTPSTPKD
jgi:hypothetical protein